MTDNKQPASPSLARRLVAMVYDALLVLALVFVVNAVALGVQIKYGGGDTRVLPPLLAQGLSLVTCMGFFCAFWLKSGQTLGMQAWRIKLVDSSGAKPGTVQALLRCLGALLSAACLGLGYLWCLVDKQGRYWHDHLSGTELVLLPRPEKKNKKKADASAPD